MVPVKNVSEALTLINQVLMQYKGSRQDHIKLEACFQKVKQECDQVAKLRKEVVELKNFEALRKDTKTAEMTNGAFNHIGNGISEEPDMES